MSALPTHPFELVFGPLADQRFPPIQAALPEHVDIDAFMLALPALEFLRDLRPEEGLGDGVDEFVAFVHAAYRFWEDGQLLTRLDAPMTRQLCADTPTEPSPPLPLTTAYIQVAPRLIWGQLDGDENYEPLDGWFAVPNGPAVRVVACFGVHANRPGLSLLVAEGQVPRDLQREDGSSLFAPLMPGGDTAGLHAVVAPEELLLLAWRAVPKVEA